jgi:NDP-sugar pyrophosphorylase family protein
MINTIVIAAAGRGTRMKHLSEDKSKHMVSVAGKPFFYYVLKSLKAAGFERVIVVIGYQAEVMQAFLDEQDMDITTVVQPDVVGDKYGTAAVLEAAADAIGNEPFVYMNGDSLYTENVFSVIAQDDGMNRVLGTYHPDPTQYGVIEAGTDGVLTRIVEKPKEPVCNVINMGLYSCTPSIFDVLPRVEKSPRGEYEIIDAINMLAADGVVRMEQLDGGWVDLGKPEDIPQVEKFIVENRLV